MEKVMDIITLEWRPRYWTQIREHLDLTTTDVFDITGIDPLDVEDHNQTDRSDKYRLACFYNEMLREEGSEYRMSLVPTSRKNGQKGRI